MKTRIKIKKLITITMAVAAMAVIGSSWTTQAQGRLLVATELGIYGFVPGQTARFCVAYPPTTQEGTRPVRAQIMLYDAGGNEVARSREEEVAAGQFRIFDFNRDDLPLAGEPNTGRVQVRGVMQVAFMDGSVRPVKLSVSTEVMDNRTGTTTVKRSADLNDLYVFLDPNDNDR